MKILLLFTIHQTTFEFLTRGIFYGETPTPYFFVCIYTDFPTVLHTSTCQIAILLYTLSLTKEPLSFGAEPCSIRRYREYFPPEFSFERNLIRKFSKNFLPGIFVRRALPVRKLTLFQTPNKYLQSSPWKN